MSDIVVILFLALCLYKVDYCKGKNNYWNDYLSKENTLMLRGVFSIVIILHHLSRNISPLTRLYSYFVSAGLWAVMIFFFFSGYGVMYNYINKQEYEKSFLTNRFKSILPLYLIAILVYWLVNEILGHHYSVIDLLNTMTSGYPIVLHSWYILVISVFYLLFYLQMKTFKRNYTLILLSSIILCFIWVLLRKYFGYGGWLSNYIFCLPLGMAWSLYKITIDKIAHKYYWIIFPFFFLMFIISWKFSFSNKVLFYLFEYGGNIYRQSMLFPIVVMLFSMKFKIGNIILKYLGSMSLEIYIFHGLFSSLLFPDINIPESLGGFIYSLISIVCSVIFALVVKCIFSKVKSYLNIKQK